MIAPEAVLICSITIRFGNGYPVAITRQFGDGSESIDRPKRRKIGPEIRPIYRPAITPECRTCITHSKGRANKK